jgi:D-amino-acid dehydrogenase
MEADGVATAGTGWGRCGLLSIGLRAHEDGWFSPFADTVLRRAPDEVAEITPEEAGALFPPLGPVHRVLHAPGSARVDGRGVAAALRAASQARGVEFVRGAAHGVTAGTDTRIGGGAGNTWGRHVDTVAVEGHQNVSCSALAVAGGAWTEAVGEWLGVALPVGPTKGQIVHLGVGEETGAWPIVQPLLTHYLVPWPGGRVACGGTFEVGAGFSTSVTAAGLSELLRECLTVAPGLDRATYLETRVGLRPTSADDRAVVGRLPGWGNAWVATGHGANGLLQGPFSARALAHAITGVTLPADEAPLPASFDPGRFGAP